MAFQPIVDVQTRSVFAYEALVRGPQGESAASVLSAIDDENRYAFDQQCRVKAISLATELGLAGAGAYLSINFMPNAVYEPRACIKLTMATAERTKFPTDRLIFEFTEDESLDVEHVSHIVASYKQMGFKTALDDFGAGFSGLGLLARIQPDIVKIDRELIRDIDHDKVRRTILRHTVNLLTELGITIVCEGVETPGELAVITDTGVRLVQGYVFAKPAFEQLATPAM